MDRKSFLKTLVALALVALIPTRHAKERKYTGYNDYDDTPIYDGDTVEVESGTSFIGGEYDDKTLHRVEWCPDWGSWVLIGITQLGHNGKPSKNTLNNRWTDRRFVTARCYPLRVVA